MNSTWIFPYIHSRKPFKIFQNNNKIHDNLLVTFKMFEKICQHSTELLIIISSRKIEHDAHTIFKFWNKSHEKLYYTYQNTMKIMKFLSNNTVNQMNIITKHQKYSYLWEKNKYISEKKCTRTKLKSYSKWYISTWIHIKTYNE